MGQAWCKEKTTRAQDSKSPLDRVFVRCAHRIYPGLKDEGSVLGGATQRVTSSEIGYAGSPPRHVLARGRSIDSVDRPFHPSDWVDVNLEAPSTPRTSSAFTNLTLETNLHPATTPTSSYSNLQDATPVPPPRRRGKRNKDRPLPPKPDEETGNVFGKLKRVDTNEEPFYTSVKPLPEAGGHEGGERGEDVVDGERTRGSTKDSKNEDKRSKEIYEHKVNGTGRIIPSDVVSGKRSSYHGTSASRAAESNRRNRNLEDEEYQRFARSRSVQDSSTPNRQADAKSNENVGKNEQSKERTKNLSTVSLPNYDELEIVRRPVEPTEKDERRKERTKETRRMNSTGSISIENSPSPRLQTRRAYLEDRRGKSDTEDVEFLKYDPKKLEDWDLSDVSNCDSTHRQRSYQSSPTSEIIGENVEVDSLGNSRGSDVVDGKKLSKNVNLPKSPIMQKPESFGKTSTEVDKNSTSSTNVDQWIAGQNSHSRYFDPPTMAMCKISSNCDEKISSTNGEPFFLVEKNHRSKTGKTTDVPATSFGSTSRLFERRLSNESEPFADSYEEKELCGLGSTMPGKMVKTISDESLPREMLDSGDDNEEDFFAERSARGVRRETGKERADSGIAKTPSPSPEPRIRPEIQENDHSCLLKVLKEEGADGSNLSSMTPSLTELEAALSDLLEKDGAENDVKRGEDGTKPGPLVSSEPADQAREKSVDGSVTILAESSRAVEKPSEETLENSKSGPVGSSGLPESPIEPSIKIVKKLSADEPIETGSKGDKLNENLVDNDSGEMRDDLTTLARNPVEMMPINRKVSFCAWEESTMMEIDLTNRGESTSGQGNSEADSLGLVRRSDIPEEPPEKPSRLYRTGPEELTDKSGENVVPTPPRRKNRSNQSVSNHSQRVEEDENVQSQRVFNDRLI